MNSFTATFQEGKISLLGGSPSSRSTLELLLPILNVAGFLKFFCNDYGSFLNPNKEPGTSFVASLDVKPWNSGMWFFFDKSLEKTAVL